MIELSKLLGETDDPITIDILANQVRFSFGNIELTSKVIDGKVPDYNRVIPTAHNSKIITLDRLLLLHAAARGDPVERALPWRAHRPASGCAKIACTNNEQEEAEEEIEVAYEGAAVDIGFNINYLLDALATLSSNEITIALQDSLGQRAVYGARSHRLQIRGDADAHLTMAGLRERLCRDSVIFIPR